MPDKKQAPKQPKGDKEKQFDVCISVVHDDRQGKAVPVQKTVRYSFATEQEAIKFANQFEKA